MMIFLHLWGAPGASCQKPPSHMKRAFLHGICIAPTGADARGARPNNYWVIANKMQMVKKLLKFLHKSASNVD